MYLSPLHFLSLAPLPACRRRYKIAASDFSLLPSLTHKPKQGLGQPSNVSQQDTEPHFRLGRHARTLRKQIGVNASDQVRPEQMSTHLLYL